MDADAKVDGLRVEDAINVIKQKHFKDLTPKDFAFLKAREEFLSETDKAIYLKGEDPVKVLSEDAGRALTREERIINENRPIQEREKEVSDAKNEASLALKRVGQDLTPEQRDERAEAEAKARKAKAKELSDAAARIEKDEAQAAAEAKKTAERDAKAREKAQPVVVVGREA